MESQNNLRLLFAVTFSLIISTTTTTARPLLSPATSPSQPESSNGSPSPGPSSPSSPKDISFDFFQFFPSSISNPPSNAVSPYSEDPFLFNLSVKLHSTNVDPEIKKICDSTDHPALCMDTIAPLVRGKATVDSALEVAIKAGGEFAKQGLALVKQMAKTPGTSPELLATFKDCKNSYSTAADNFGKAMDAFPGRDVGTMRSVLSAVITFVGDCEDEFMQMQTPSPLAPFSEKLTEMASNCLAIASLM